MKAKQIKRNFQKYVLKGISNMDEVRLFGFLFFNFYPVKVLHSKEKRVGGEKKHIKITSFFQ